MLERLAVHKLHDDVAQILIADCVIDGEDMRMEQLADQRRLVEKYAAITSSQVGVLGGLILDDLDSHLAVGKRVACEVDDAGRTAAELAQDGVLSDLLGERFTHADAGGEPGVRFLGRAASSMESARGPET